MLWPVRIWGIHPVYQHPVFGTGGTHFPIQDIQYPPPNLFPKRHEQPQAPCLDDNHGMKFDNAWNQGVWYALRSATGRPSPQPFSVENLPALGEECRRIMKITSAVYTSKKTLSKRWFASAELLNLYLTKYGLSCLNCSRKKTTACWCWTN